MSQDFSRLLRIFLKVPKEEKQKWNQEIPLVFPPLVFPPMCLTQLQVLATPIICIGQGFVYGQCSCINFEGLLYIHF